MKSRRETRY